MPINVNDGEALGYVHSYIMVDIISKREDVWLGGLYRRFTNLTWRDVNISLLQNVLPDIYL